MNQKRCPKGHFYDADRFASCPHCANERTESIPLQGNRTAAASPVSSWEDLPLRHISDITPMPGSAAAVPDDDGKTVALFESSEEQQCVVGWLVCVKGNQYGQSFVLHSGRNTIGRSKQMDICLEGERSVSRDRHAILLYEPRQNCFLVQMGDSRELVYVNNQLVTTMHPLKKNDLIQLGNVELMLIPCCDEAFVWEKPENGLQK